jgi:rubrerythrin
MRVGPPLDRDYFGDVAFASARVGPTGPIVSSMGNNQTASSDDVSVQRNEEIYNDDGVLVGVVGDATEEGFTVETVASATVEHGDDARSEEEEPGQEFGEGYIMWRCTECGEMGELDEGFPETCPNCGAPKEAITKDRED